MRERIGFVGLGNMGQPMAENLARAGFPLTVLDLKPQPVAALVALGARGVATPAELAAASDIICSVVMNDRQTLALMLGEEGIIAHAGAGTLILIHSTVSVQTVESVAEAAQTRGIAVLDAPVSGAAERSRAGTLSVIVGGDPEHVERARPVFDVVGEKVYHMGRLGLGQVAKMCNNLMSLINVHVVEEALALAAHAGIEEARMREVAEASSGDSWALRHIDQMRELAAVHTGGAADMHIFGRKDIALACKLAGRIGVPAPVAEFVFERTKR